jgi:ABC-type transport system involved in multi-copper enzyme maturation permease subunit
MHLQKILAVALAETRSVRRLVRYWIFSILSVVLTTLMYLYYSGIHGFVSRLSATVGATGPRFLMSALGIYVLAIFLVGIIFLAFDVRARDQRERMAEVLDSRPISNIELLTGRFLGLVAMAWLPVLAVALVLQSIGGAARLFGWWMGEPVEPWSLAVFVFFDALTALALWCAVVIFLAVALRNRLLVTAIAFPLLALQVWSVFRTPIYLLPAISTLASFSNLASDVLPHLVTGTGVIQRGALWTLAGGLLLLAAALHPRPDGGSRPRKLLAGGTLVAIAFAVIAVLATQAVGLVRTRASWALAHETRRDEPRPDIATMSGTVAIDPGKRLDLDLEIGVHGLESGPLAELLFSFNPALEIDELLVDGSAADFSHQLGLLSIELTRPLHAGSSLQISLRANGVPDPNFAYLDTVRDFLTGTTFDGQIALLGTDASVFARSYVALMPGVRWLPSPGADVPNGDPSQRPADFFDVDLEVEVPAGWLVAGPGRRQTIAGGTGERFRFHPDAPVPDVGLLASRFERSAIEVAGVELELLLHRKHLRNRDFFAEAAGELAARLGELFRDAEDLGLDYPYGSLSLVETPNRLRGYGGGWRMDSVQALPAMMMLRENGFPTSRFEFGFRNPETFENREGGIAAAKVETLETFFENDFSGGNPFLGVSRNFLQFQTGARGEGALALDFVCHELVNQLLTGKGGYFSAHLFDTQSGQVIAETIPEVASGRTDSVAAAVLNAAADRPSVWDRALGASLAHLEAGDDPKQAVNVLALKGRAVARSILDGLGRTQTAQLLAELRRRHAGRNFDYADLDSIASEIGADLHPLVGDWLHEASLPGFLTSPVTAYRLRDDEQGRPRYQMRLHVRNDEPTPGLLRMRWAVGDVEDDSDWHLSDPIRVAARQSLEIGLLGSEPPAQLWLDPYFSLNRQEMRLSLPTIDEIATVDEEPFLGSRPSDWAPTDGDSIVVDDLDEGFSVESSEQDDGVRLSGGLSTLFVPQADLDQGLPEFIPFGPLAREWGRREEPSSWGKYRHTLAIVRSGDGSKKAVFAARLPGTGRWRLDYHLPVLTSSTRSASGPGVRINAQAGLGGTQGTYDMTLEVGGRPEEIEFDASAGEPGWNSLGDFEISSPEVRVLISDESSGRAVIADAIRWTPLSVTSRAAEDPAQ